MVPIQFVLTRERRSAKLLPEYALTLIPQALCRAFLMQPGPGTGPIQCVLTRERRGAKLFPEYALHLEVGRRFLLAARKRKKSASAHYLLSSDSQVPNFSTRWMQMG